MVLVSTAVTTAVYIVQESISCARVATCTEPMNEPHGATCAIGCHARRGSVGHAQAPCTVLQLRST